MGHHSKPFLETALVASLLLLSVPQSAFSHVGHGDEFQATGGIERVAVNAETDPMLGILVSPIEQAGDAGVMVPATALVDADGKQLVFVQYENFYEPVEVTTGASQGDLIEVTSGLSVGEQLVTQGNLSLYAESRKTQTVDASASPDAIATSPTDLTHAQADAQGKPHSHDAAGNMAQASGEGAQGGMSKGLLAAAGGGVLLVLGAIALAAGKVRKQPSSLPGQDEAGY